MMKLILTHLKISTSIFIFYLMGLFLNTKAQDIGYVHTTNSENTIGQITYLDHPLINDNPNANVLFSQRRIEGSAAALNYNPTGIYYYNGSWIIFNENLTAFNMGVQFNIYISTSDEVQIHTAIEDNTNNYYTYLEGFTQFDYLFYNNTFSPHSTYNPHQYGNFYSGTSGKRVLYTETAENIPIFASFRVLNSFSSGSTQFSEVSTIYNNTTSKFQLDHPLLNGNPNAVFLYSHYWGFNEETQVTLPYVSEAYYTDGYWHIHINNSDFFPPGIWMDIVVPNTILGIENYNSDFADVQIYPNPVRDKVNFESENQIEKIQIFNTLGQKVFESNYSNSKVELNLSKLPSGLYVAKTKTKQGWINKKLIKQ